MWQTLKTLQRVTAETSKPIDHSPIWEWAQKEIVLAGAYVPTGEFRLGKETHLKRIFDCFSDHTTREIYVCGGIQLAKSMASDIILYWSIVNRSGPTMLVFQQNDVVQDHMSSRIIPTIQASPILKSFAPHPKDISINRIRFPHMQLFASGPSEGRLQSKSIRHVFGSEMWQWDEGTIDYLRSRTSEFSRYQMEKLVFESQAGWEDTDWHRAWMDGTREYWSVPCLGCGKLFAPKWKDLTCSGKKWNDPELGLKLPDGSYHIGKLEKMLTVTCPECGHHHQDTESTKTQWALGGKYVQTNFNPRSNVVSLHFNAFIRTSWIKLFELFTSANMARKNQDFKPLQIFFQQRMAEFIPREYTGDIVRTIAYSDYKTEKEEDDIIFITIDVQEYHYACCVRAWKRNGDSRLLEYTKLYSVDEIEAIRKKYNLKPIYVWMDSGGSRTRETYQICIDYGYNALKGEGVRGYYKKVNGKQTSDWVFWDYSTKAGDPAMGTAQQGKVGRANAYLFAVNPIKDLLETLIYNKSQYKWEVCDLGPLKEEWEQQMSAEKKTYKVNRKGIIEHWWVRRDHKVSPDAWDTEVYQLGAALMHPLISIKERYHLKTKSSEKSE